jgi:uncharacterized membrane protein (DUF485 family)
MIPHDTELRTLAAARRRIAVRLTGVMVLIYFGFLALIAWQKPLLGRLILPGLTLGIALGALVIVSCWVLTWIYVRWANTHYDPTLDRIRKGE